MNICDSFYSYAQFWI